MVLSWFTSVKIVIEKLIQAKLDSENSWQSYGEVHEIAGWYEIQFVLLPGLSAAVSILSWIVEIPWQREWFLLLICRLEKTFNLVPRDFCYEK